MVSFDTRHAAMVSFIPSGNGKWAVSFQEEGYPFPRTPSSLFPEHQSSFIDGTKPYPTARALIRCSSFPTAGALPLGSGSEGVVEQEIRKK